MASVGGGMHPETGHYKEFFYGPCADHDRAMEIKRSLYRCAKRLGYSMKAEVVAGATGGYMVRFNAIDKRKARAYIAALYKGREHQLPYNPYRRTKQE
ncbi:MAG: hypothetical protein ACRDNK_04195 [Solirubrobacteraceae bacterium]